VTRLDEALASAEKMAMRVDRVLEEDLFAAAVLAREYLSLVPELDVDPLNQRGRTDAWTTAFVRLRFAGGQLDKHARREEGMAYLAARAEERRFFTLYGSAPRARLMALRGEVRRKRGQENALRGVAYFSAAGALAAFAVAFALGSVWIAAAGAVAGALVAGSCLAAGRSVGRALAPSIQRAEELERGISALAVFEKSEAGRGLLQRIQRQHPLLVRTSLGEGSTVPPPVSENRRRQDL
jgi:hypothetical protein